jgi:membrane protease YdiL (CAAX protease family)
VFFAIKRSAEASLALAVILGVAAFATYERLGLVWHFEVSSSAAAQVAFCLALLLAVDAALHLGLRWAIGPAYSRRFSLLIDYFTRHNSAAVVMAGLLAAIEELVFRGILMQWLVMSWNWSAATAGLAAAAAFGLAHVMPDRRLWPFAIWAAWQGWLLGLVYWATGSILVVAAVHLVHDGLAFGWFAWQRRAKPGLESV